MPSDKIIDNSYREITRIMNMKKINKWMNGKKKSWILTTLVGLINTRIPGKKKLNKAEKLLSDGSE